MIPKDKQGRLLKRPLAAMVAILGMGSLAAEAGVLYFDFNQNYNPPNASVFLFGQSDRRRRSPTWTASARMSHWAWMVFNLSIPNSHQQSGTGIKTSGFQVVSPNPIAGYFVNRAPATTDMTYLFDSNALGNNYLVSSQGGGFGEGSQVMIHATQDNTAVTFTPKGGAAINVVLNAGETYKHAGGSANLTGSLVSADKPVAVFGGTRARRYQWVPLFAITCSNR